MTTQQIIESANKVLALKISSIKQVNAKSKSSLQFGCQVSNGITILFSPKNTFIDYNGILYKGTLI